MSTRSVSTADDQSANDSYSDYATKVFGFATFGRVYGAIICISGMIQFVQTGLDAVTQGPLKGNPTPINILLAALNFVAGTILVVFVQTKGRQMARKLSEEDALAERERLLPQVEEESDDEY